MTVKLEMASDINSTIIIDHININSVNNKKTEVALLAAKRNHVLMTQNYHHRNI